MKLRIENGLLIASLELKYGENKQTFENVLIDTGCAVTIFDTDMMDDIGLQLDILRGIPTKMYGVGGDGEVCYQQRVHGLCIDGQQINQFEMQLGMVSDMYGFDGLLGIDFMLHTGIDINFSKLQTSYDKDNT